MSAISKLKLGMTGLVLLSSLSAPTSAWAKAKRGDRLKVCTVTINSANESNVFRSRLKDQADFIELTDFAKPGSGDSGSDPADPSKGWFSAACRSGVQCDVLVVSGHFIDGFFGESGLSLDADELQAHRCRKDCDGILKNPAEVFLFGCNTLAGERGSKLSDDELLSYLKNQKGFSERNAKRMLTLQKEKLTTDVRSTVQRAFEGVSRIYGFGFIGPAGNSIELKLKDYFDRVGDYGSHLLKLKAARSLEVGIEKEQALFNAEWERSMQGTSVDQCSGMESSLDPESAKRQARICEFYREDLTRHQLLELISSSLEEKGREAYFPVIMKFLRGAIQGPQLPADQALLNRILASKSARDSLRTNIDALASPLTKAAWIELADLTGWLSAAELKRHSREVVLELLDGLNEIKTGQLCQLNFAVSRLARLDVKDLPQSLFNTTYGVKALACLQIGTDPAYLEKLSSEALKINVPANPKVSEGLIKELLVYLPHMNASQVQALRERFKEWNPELRPEAGAKVSERAFKARLALELELFRKTGSLEAKAAFLSAFGSQNDAARIAVAGALEPYLSGSDADVEKLLFQAWEDFNETDLKARQFLTLVLTLAPPAESREIRRWAESTVKRLVPDSFEAKRIRQWLEK